MSHQAVPEPYVKLDHPGPGVWRLTLNQASKFNPLSEAMIAALSEQLDHAGRSEACRVVVLAAAGRAFCAGHDLAEMLQKPEAAYYNALFQRCTNLMLKIQALPQPVIAQVQGIATAAGCQLVAMCDLAIAADSARFAVSGINYGLFCSTPSVAVSRGMHRKQAMEMLLTGDFIDAAAAVERGLINKAVPAAELEAETLALCTKIASKPAVAVRLGKGLFYQQLETGIEHAYELAGQTMACNMMDEAAQEGFKAFVEKREPAWRKAT